MYGLAEVDEDEGEDEDHEAELGGEAAAGDEGGPVEDEPAVGPLPDVVAVLEDVDGVLREGPDPVPEGPPPAPAFEGVEIAETSDDRTVFLSTLGYVRSTRPPYADFEPNRTLGLVCDYSDGNTICGSCHLHPRCALKRSKLRVTRMQLAEWLATGEVPPAGASRDEKLAIGARHRGSFAY